MTAMDLFEGAEPVNSPKYTMTTPTHEITQ